MPSLDHAYELAQKLMEENVEYIIICVRKGQKEDAASIFLNITSDESIPSFTQSMNIILSDLDKNLNEE